MLKKIGIHFEESILNKLNQEMDIKLSHLINFLLSDFLKNIENKSLEDKNELQKDIQKFILKSKK